jgi:acetyltransferase-like isoleucine patch superfamily enzyme
MHRNSRVLDFSSLTADTVVEEGAFIGVGVITQNDNSFNHGGKLEPPIFKKGCMVGGNSTILPGVVIGENARVSAGSIVRKSVPPGSLTWAKPAGTREPHVTNDDILDEWAEDTVNMLEKYYDSRG